MGDDTYYIDNWLDLFAEITYAYDKNYCPVRHEEKNGEVIIEFYKLVLTSNGEGGYKTDNWRFDPALWPKVELLYKLFENNGVIDILYAPNSN